MGNLKGRFFRFKLGYIYVNSLGGEGDEISCVRYVFLCRPLLGMEDVERWDQQVSIFPWDDAHPIDGVVKSYDDLHNLFMISRGQDRPESDDEDSGMIRARVCKASSYSPVFDAPLLLGYLC